MARYIFMSFKPIYAFKIVNLEKDCEIRTYFRPVEIGDRVLIYASSPVKEVIGEFIVEDVVVGKFNDIKWYLIEKCTKFDEDNWRFVEEHYVNSTRKLIVIKIGEVVKYRRSISLSMLRELIPRFTPPISYTYIDEETYSKIKRIGSVWEDIITFQ